MGPSIGTTRGGGKDLPCRNRSAFPITETETELNLSARQAYRYLEQAAQLEAPVEVAEVTVPITLKLPPSTIFLLRTHAARSGLTIGTLVTRALDAFLSALRKHG